MEERSFKYKRPATNRTAIIGQAETTQLLTQKQISNRLKPRASKHRDGDVNMTDCQDDRLSR